MSREKFKQTKLQLLECFKFDGFWDTFIVFKLGWRGTLEKNSCIVVSNAIFLKGCMSKTMMYVKDHI